jgi:hypothetical protein
MSTYKSPVTNETIEDYMEAWLCDLTEDEFDNIYKPLSEEQASENRRKGIKI